MKKMREKEKGTMLFVLSSKHAQGFAVVVKLWRLINNQINKRQREAKGEIVAGSEGGQSFASKRHQNLLQAGHPR